MFWVDGSGVHGVGVGVQCLVSIFVDGFCDIAGGVILIGNDREVRISAGGLPRS